MNYKYFFGPDKQPFFINENGKIQQEISMPFHGIISRGVLNQCNESGCSIWNTHSHLLEYNDLVNESEELYTLRLMALKCNALSFAESAQVVKKYLESKDQDTNDKLIDFELWNIKEGHTTSVWKVTAASTNNIETFIVNVARDEDAGIELKTISEKLKTIGDQFSESNSAKIYEITEIALQNEAKQNVIVTKNEWIENAYEIHSRKAKETQEDELLLVERFLTLPDKPAQITSILGRVFTPAEIKKINQDISKFLTQASTCLPDTPTININDGDVVWNGEQAIVIAINQ